jgi:hypothetical protein
MLFRFWFRVYAVHHKLHAKSTQGLTQPFRYIHKILHCDTSEVFQICFVQILSTFKDGMCVLWTPKKYMECTFPHNNYVAK